MPIRHTTVPTLKAAAYDALVAAFADLDVPLGEKPVKVSYGAPTEANFGPQMVFLAGVVTDEDWSAIGNSSRDENYTVVLVVNVELPGKTQQQATERAYELLNVCDDALTSSSEVQLLPPPARTLVQFGRLVERPGASSREAEIVAGLRVWARL